MCFIPCVMLPGSMILKFLNIGILINPESETVVLYIFFKTTGLETAPGILFL